MQGPPPTTPPPAVADRDALIEQHRSYVRALAVKVMQTLPSHVELGDLVAYGEIGLVEAAERFDPRRGVAFSTFAHYRIKGAVYDGLREMGYYSRSASVRVRWAPNANDIVQSAVDDAQTSAETASASVDDEIAAASQLIDALIPVYLLSLHDESVPEVADQGALSVEQIERRELAGLALQAVAELSPEEQQLIDALYFKHVSTTELAARMGVNKSWVSRLHSRAIKRLRERLAGRGVLED